MFEGRLPMEKKESYDSAIVIRVFRHGDKEMNLTPEDQARWEELKKQGLEIDPDNWKRLTNTGRAQAFAAGDIEGDLSQSVAYGGPRIRSQETAMHVMDGSGAGVGPEASFEETMDKLNEGLEVGSKIGVDERLNFNVDTQEQTGKDFMKALKTGKTLEWLINESDRTALENGDTKTYTYSKMAGNVASMIERYYKASDRWNDLVEDSSKGYKPELKRYCGTHGTITESFLAKVMEKTRGKDFRDKFIGILDGNGFDFVEGAQIKIENKGGQKKIVVEYHKDLANGEKFDFKEEVSPEILHEIVKEGQDLAEQEALKKAA